MKKVPSSLSVRDHNLSFSTLFQNKTHLTQQGFYQKNKERKKEKKNRNKLTKINKLINT